MPNSDRQISAFISASTKDLLERYTGARGVKKGHFIEEALLHHLRALRELPADVLVPPRLTVDETTAETLARRWDEPREPTEAMTALFSEE